MELTNKQKEILQKMRKGQILEVNIREGNKVNKYYLGNSLKPISRKAVIDLYSLGFLAMRSINFNTRHLELTNLGKTFTI